MMRQHGDCKELLATAQVGGLVAASRDAGGAAEILDGSSSEPETPTVLDGAAGAQRDLDPRFVVPADVGIQRRDELLNGRGQPGARVEQLGLQAAEEALARCVVWRVPLARHRTNQLRISDP